MNRHLLVPLALLPLAFSGCESPKIQAANQARLAMQAAISAETPGDYYVGRRFYKRDYKFWGYVRRPQQPWSTAQLVMLDENQKLAPDRAQNTIGSDNNYEYKLMGDYSGQTVYEPASNSFYPEFTLKGYELRSLSPANIFKTPGATDPARRVIPKPY